MLSFCTAIDCGALALPTNGTMTGRKTVFPYTIKFGCDKGFDLIGSKTRKCLSSGKWSGIHSICKGMKVFDSKFTAFIWDVFYYSVCFV